MLKFGLLLFVTWVHAYEISLTTRSTLYVPYDYFPNGTARYSLDEVAVEQTYFDYEENIVYAVGDTTIHAIDVSDPDNMTILTYVEYSGVEFTDVELCGGYLFAGVDDKVNRDQGRVMVFNTLNRTSLVIEELLQVAVGAVPDMVKPTSDCTKLVVAVEAEARAVNDTTIVDPEGKVVIITFPDGVVNESNYNVVSLDFTAYNDRMNELSESGVRHVYQANGNPFSNDAEPEYISINSDNTIAYITLQENNAVAVVDLVTQNLTRLHGLGFKNWSMSSLDPSDKDRAGMIYPYNVQGMYQPDSTYLFTFKGEDYLAMANEGDSKEYRFGNTVLWSEEARGEDLINDMTANLDETTKDQLKKDSLLGRLKVSVSPAGIYPNGSLKALYSFGGRSFSIRRASDMSVVYDSGDDISRRMFEHRHNLFNAHIDSVNDVPYEGFDVRSDDKGSETESLTVGVIDGVTLLFIGNERPGIILCYSIHDDITKPVFRAIIDGIPNKRSKSWQQQYDDRELSLIDPEDLHFVPADKSPTGKPALFAAGSVSGTLSIIDIEVTPDATTTTPKPQECVHVNAGIRAVPDAVFVLIVVSLISLVVRL